MTGKTAGLVATILVVFASAAAAQDHSMHGMNMPGMEMPKPATKKPPAKASATRAKPPKGASPKVRPKSAPKSSSAAVRGTGHGAMQGMDHSATPSMDHSTMPGMVMPAQDQQAPQGGGSMQGMEMPGDVHSGHSMPGMEGVAQTGTALPPGNEPAPAVPSDHAADRVYGTDAMMMGRHRLQHHHGGQGFYQVLFNLAEYQFRSGRDGYRWDGEAWFGGDINRLFVKTEGEGTFRKGVEAAEVQALYSRAIGPYFNLQAGVRQDLGRFPRRTYATIGFEGLAPGYFEVEGAAFLSNKGDLLGRLEGYYDQRITQRLILQPRAELNFAAQDVPENGIGSGLSSAELGLRLRYEIRREFAPYVGVSWERKVGDTARLARAADERAEATSFVVGIRTWF